MDEQQDVAVAHRPVPYHPSVVAPKPVVNADQLPNESVREIAGAARVWRTLFWVTLGTLSVGTMAFAGLLAATL